MSFVSRVQEQLAKIKKENKNINAFLFVRSEKELLTEAKTIEDKIKKGTAGKLAGKTVGVKANLCVQGLPTHCASKTLDGFLAPYDATAIRRVKEEDGLILGILNMDEFASGASGETSAFGPTKNPHALAYVPGGSSSGPAAAVSAGFCDISLGTDTGGSIRNPASHCGIFGLKPTYGRVSRYGLIDLAMSTDTIGPLAKSSAEILLSLQVLSGVDSRDPSTLQESFNSPKKPRIGLLDIPVEDERIASLITEKITALAKRKEWSLETISLPSLSLAVATYYPLVYVEAFSGTRKFDGRRFGKNIEESVGPEFLRRILGGAEITKAEYGGRYYHKALQAKALITRELTSVFDRVDVLISPTVPRLPHKIGEDISVESMYQYDTLTIPASLAGLPALSVPVGELAVKGDESSLVPVGMQLMGPAFSEEFLLTLSEEFS